MNNYKKIFEAIAFVLYFAFNITFILFLSMIVYNVVDSTDLEKYNITFVVILITSIATGSFFLIKIYIENQLGVKEKEMLKEYQDALDKQTKEQNHKFDEQNRKFDEQNRNMVTKEEFKQVNQKLDKVIEKITSI